jgi:glutamate racemase
MKSIGIFDSGIGGLTVFSEIEKTLPNENLIYLGDTARVPYGTKSKETIERFALEIVQFLLKHEVKFLIAACNTVSALALPLLKKQLDVPILGVIEPAVQKALESSKGRVGVIGTRATVESQAYEKVFYRLNPNIKVWSKACPLFVSLVEENWMDQSETDSIAQKYLTPLLQHKIDTLILGCTHYPLLRSVIQKIVGPEVTLIDSAQSTASACHQIMMEKNLANSNGRSQNRFFVTDEPERIQKMAEKFLGHSIPKVERANLDSAFPSLISFSNTMNSGETWPRTPEKGLLG